MSKSGQPLTITQHIFDVQLHATISQDTSNPQRHLLKADQLPAQYRNRSWTADHSQILDLFNHYDNAIAQAGIFGQYCQFTYPTLKIDTSLTISVWSAGIDPPKLPTTPRSSIQRYGTSVSFGHWAIRRRISDTQTRALGTPLAWPEAKKVAGQVREWGIEVGHNSTRNGERTLTETAIACDMESGKG